MARRGRRWFQKSSIAPAEKQPLQSRCHRSSCEPQAAAVRRRDLEVDIRAEGGEFDLRTYPPRRRTCRRPSALPAGTGSGSRRAPPGPDRRRRHDHLGSTGTPGMPSSRESITAPPRDPPTEAAVPIPRPASAKSRHVCLLSAALDRDGRRREQFQLRRFRNVSCAKSGLLAQGRCPGKDFDQPHHRDGEPSSLSPLS